jgi:photosystem II stability/assembly factor-like uncharacterized protein
MPRKTDIKTGDSKQRGSRRGWIRPLAAGGAIAAIVAAAAIPLWSQPSESIPLPRLLGSTHVHGLAVDRADPSRLLIATHHGFYVASPGGSARRVSEHQDDLMGFTPHPTNPKVLYASGHPAEGGNLGFIASEDGGRTWRQLSPGISGPVDFHQMDVSKADPRVIYGNFGGLQVSRDGGRTWNRVGGPIQGLIDLAASSLEANTLFMAAQDGLQLSRDGGQSWQPALLQVRPATLVDVMADGTVYAYIVGMGLMRAKEPSLNWERLSEDLGQRVLLHLTVDPKNKERLYAVARGNELMASTDGGRTWRSLARP